MSKLLGIVGSPRRGGNTHVLVSTMLDAAREQGAAGEIVLLGDLTIRECDGCHACWRGKPCSKSDDMAELYPKLIASDAIIFGTPVYWYGPTALMKALVDRLVYFNCPDNRAKIRGKPAAIAVPYEEEGPEAAALVVEFFVKCLRYLEMELVGKLLVPGVGERGQVLRKADCLEQARALGRELGGCSPGH